MSIQSAISTTQERGQVHFLREEHGWRGRPSGNGIKRTITRNTRGLPQRVTDQRFGVAVFDEQYSWDSNGNLESQTDWLNTPAGTRWLGYDGRDRLTSSWISGYGNESFGWDAFDRLRWRNSWSGAETFNYDGTHRLTSINGPSGTRWYGHDARGNVTGRPGFTHIYDAANRLTETPGVGRFEYDGHGRRTVTWRADGTAKVDFYTVDGKVRYKTDSREGGGTDYVYLGDQLVAEHKGPWRSTRGTIYTHTDHLGSPIVRTNNLAHVYSRDRRTNFGAPLTLNPVEAEAGYTGHIEDPEQGLVYMQQRYYDPAIARFLSVDPVGPLADPSNHFGRYHYAYNNPYRFTDPDGRLPVLIPAAIGGLVGLSVGIGMEGYRQFKLGQIDVTALAVEAGKGAIVGGAVGLTGAAAGGMALTGQVAVTASVGFGVGAGSHAVGEVAKGNLAPSAGQSMAIGAATAAGAAVGAAISPISGPLTSVATPAVSSHPVVSLSGKTFHTVNVPAYTVPQPAAAEIVNSAAGAVVEEAMKPR